MIKPVEIYPHGHEELLNRLFVAVNMLIEEHNCLIEAVMDEPGRVADCVSAYGLYEQPHTFWKDPNV